MTKNEQAKIILEALEEYVSVDHSFEEFYLKGIIKGLVEIEKKSQK
jgi:hypothetical protein